MYTVSYVINLKLNLTLYEAKARALGQYIIDD